ncbi:MAG: BCAM0308 family protein, partial [Planctomycetota bacterium]
TISLRGLPKELQDEVIETFRRVAARERKEHPLERLIQVQEKGDRLFVTTTGIHLARSIAGALRRRFKKGVQIRYLGEDNLVQIDWQGAR